MADAKLLVQLTKNFFTRNNPAVVMTGQFNHMVEFVTTFQSQIKLMKFRFMLYKQQMGSIEQNLQAGAISPQGFNVDRYY